MKPLLEITDQAAQQENIKARKAAYKALIKACRAACQAEFPVWYVDQTYPYPLFTVDAEKGEIVLGKSYTLKVDSNGQISGDIDVHDAPDPAKLINKFFRDRQASICDRYMKKFNEVIASGSANGFEDHWICVRENWATFSAFIGQYDICDYKDGIKLALNLEKPERWSGIVAEKSKTAFVAAVKQLLDRNNDIAWLRRRLFWIGQVKVLEFKHWNMIAAYLETIKQIQADSPRMVTLFATAVLLPATKKKAKKPKISPKNPKGAISAFRDYLISLGLSPAAWRWISHLPCPVAAKVVSGVVNGKRSMAAHYGAGARLANICAERQIKPKTSIYDTALVFLNDVRDHEHADDLVFALLTAKSVDVHSTSVVIDWLVPKPKEPAPFEATQIAVGRPWPDSPVLTEGVNYKPPKGIGWKRLLELARDWHDKAQLIWDAQSDYHDDIERLLGKTKSKHDKSWVSLVSTCSNDLFVATALTTKTDLRIEGRRMHHCVGGYSADCQKGLSRIFSITSDMGKRVATLELVCRSGRWNVKQCFGYCNSPVGDEVFHFAEKVCAEYQVAYLKQINEELKAA